MTNPSNAIILSGTWDPDFSQRVAQYLGTSLGQVEHKQFADGECFVEIKDNVKGKDVYIIQSTCKPVNDNLMQLILMVSACQRAGCASVTTIIPYYGYARAERRHQNKQVPMSAVDVAQILQFMGVKKIVTLDLHCIASVGACGTKTVWEDYEAAFTAIDFFKNEISDMTKLCIVAPDAGAVKRAKGFHEKFESQGFQGQIGLALMHKERKVANQVEEVILIGDVQDKICIIIDDMSDTSGTLCKAADEIKAKGASKVYALVTHGIFSDPAAQRIKDSIIEKVVSTDTIKLSQDTIDGMGGKLIQVSVDLLVAEVIRRTHQNEQVQDIFDVPTYKN